MIRFKKATGRHSVDVGPEHERFIERVLTRAGFSIDDDWVVDAAQKRYAARSCKPFKVTSAGASYVQVFIRPGDSDSGRLCRIIPNGNGVTLPDLHDKLSLFEEQEYPDVHEETHMTVRKDASSTGEKVSTNTEGLSEVVRVEKTPNTHSLKGFTKDSENIALLLLALQKSGADKRMVVKKVLQERIRKELGFGTEVTNIALAKILTALSGKNHALLVGRQNRQGKLTHYKISEKGFEFLQGYGGGKSASIEPTSKVMPASKPRTSVRQQLSVVSAGSGDDPINLALEALRKKLDFLDKEIERLSSKRTKVTAAIKGLETLEN